MVKTMENFGKNAFKEVMECQHLGVYEWEMVGTEDLQS